MTAVIFPIARGISIGTGITDLKRFEDSVRVGRHAILTAVSQASQVNYAFTLADMALEPDGIHPAIKTVAYLTPPLLALVVKIGVNSPEVRAVALAAQDHIGTLCHVAAAISAIALIYFGHLAIGIISLTFIAIGFLDRMGVLPESIRHPIHEYSPIVQIATGIIVGDLFEKGLAAVSLAIYCYDKIFARTEAPPIAQNPIKPDLTLELFQEILDEKVELEMDRTHLFNTHELPSPDEDIDELLTLSEEIDWNEHLAPIKLKLADDDRFKELYGDPAEMIDEELISMIKENLPKYIHSIKSRHIAEGEIHDYEKIENYLKFVTSELKKSDDPIEKADALMRLSIEGGGYCGPAKFHVAEDLYALHVLKNEDGTIPTETKILFILQEARGRWFDGRYLEFLDRGNAGCCTQVMEHLVGYRDLHFYNQFVNAAGHSFGLRRASADNDRIAMLDPISKSLISKLSSRISIEFDEDYTKDFIVEEIEEKVGTRGLPRYEISQLLKSWVEKQDLAEDRKEELLEEIQENHFLGHRIEDDNRRLNKHLLSALLLDIKALNCHASRLM